MSMLQIGCDEAMDAQTSEGFSSYGCIAIVMHIGACEMNARALVVRKESQISYMTAAFFLID